VEWESGFVMQSASAVPELLTSKNRDCCCFQVEMTLLYCFQVSIGDSR
jgi:hypothetical protein